MPTMTEVRAKFPQYNDMSDEQLADALHRKFYSDLPRDEFNSKIGLAKPNAAAPESKGVLRTVDDAVRGVADMLTFGFADEIAAGAGAATGVGSAGGDYAANVAAERARDAEGGAARFGGQLAGAVMMPGAAARSVGGAAVRGGVQGAAYGFGSGEGGLEDRAVNAGVGLATGAAVGGAVGGITNKLATRAAAKSIPTTEALRKTGEDAYKLVGEAGVVVAPSAMQKLGTKVTQDLTEFGYHPQLQPRVGVVLDEIGRLSDQNVTLKGVDQLRKIAKSASASLDPSERAIGQKIVGRIDDLMVNLGEGDVIMGNAPRAVANLKFARDIWGRMRKAELVESAATKAERRAASTGTGGNADNAMRQNIRGILDNPRKSAGFTQAERDAAEKVVRGTPLQNAARLGGRLSPRGSGLMAALGGGATFGAPHVAIPAMIAADLLKRYADKQTPANIKLLSQTIRSGGQTAKELVRKAAQGEGHPELVEAVQRILAQGGAAANVGAPLASAEAQQLVPY